MYISNFAVILVFPVIVIEWRRRKTLI